MSHTLEHHIPATPDQVWHLWTTAEGINQWWAPEGFRTEVNSLELREGGQLLYTMTATAPDQVAFMEEAGLPLSTTSHKTFTHLHKPNRLAYTSLIDFVPDHEPYNHLTTIELTEHRSGTHVVMTIEPLHDDVWTQRLIAGRTNELVNLERVTRELERRRRVSPSVTSRDSQHQTSNQSKGTP